MVTSLRANLEETVDTAYGRTYVALVKHTGFYKSTTPIKVLVRVLPNGIMQYKLSIPLSPVVSNTTVLVNDQGLNTKLLQTSSHGQATLTGAYQGSAQPAVP